MALRQRRELVLAAAIFDSDVMSVVKDAEPSRLLRGDAGALQGQPALPSQSHRPVNDEIHERFIDGRGQRLSTV
jgi:hypothetical protein